MATRDYTITGASIVSDKDSFAETKNTKKNLFKYKKNFK